MKIQKNLIILFSFLCLIGFSFCSENDKGSSTSREISENEIIDKRDDQIYPTVKIGEQIWLGKNLNFKTPNSFCYQQNELECENLGRFYTQVEAMEACPQGWKLPTDEDWKILEKTLGMAEAEIGKFREYRGQLAGEKLKTHEDFNMVFGGVGSSEGRLFQGKNVVAQFWSATDGPVGSNFAIFRMFSKSKGAIYSDQAPKASLCCVRCLKE